jgi:hypothetical protein
VARSCGACESYFLSSININLNGSWSTHNTRIERIWVEVATQFTRRWRGFFARLECLHHLNCHNPHHLWLLQMLFLDLINIDCNAFQADWNNHPMSSTHNRSPLVRFIQKPFAIILQNMPCRIYASLALPRMAQL